MIDKIKPGNTFPDFELPDHTDTLRKLSVLQGNNPMVLVLSRGKFCPKDQTQMKDLIDFSMKCTVGYSVLVTIAKEDLIGINEYRQTVGANWPFLYDEDGKVRDELEILEYTDQKHKPMIPYTLVLEPGLKVYKVYNGYHYWGRPTTHELHMDLREITKKIRPDYKIDTDEMRQRWKKDEKEAFYPYGQSGKETLARMNYALDQYGD